jgi:hypothetical protein
MMKDITVVDLATLSVTSTIPTPDWTESMIRYNNYIFVSCIGEFNQPNSKRQASIQIINTKEDKIVDSITAGKEPLSMVIDRKLKIWVLCTGGFDNYEPPTLLRIDPELRIVEKIFTFPDAREIPSKLCINPTGDTLYYLKNGIFKMPVSASSLPSQPIISSSGHLFYGLAINPFDGTIYSTDAVDYVQNGWAYQFNQNSGALLKSYPAGRIPGSFCFVKTEDSK